MAIGQSETAEPQAERAEDARPARPATALPGHGPQRAG